MTRVPSMGVSSPSLTAVITLLAALEGVSTVEVVADGADPEFLVHNEFGQGIAAIVSQAVHGRGWEVVEMHVETGRLDTVFRELTKGGA